MNFKTTIILIVLLALAGVYLAIDRFTGTSDKPAEPVAKKVIDLDPTSVTELKITPASGVSFALAKKEGKWRLSQPVDAPADQFAVEDLLRNLVGFASKGQTDPAPAKYTVELTANGQSTQYTLSDKSLVGEVIYLQPQGAAKAEIIPADIDDRLAKGYDDLRDKQLVSTPSSDIKQLRVEYAGTKYALAKTGSTWQITEPQAMPADNSVVSDLLFAITGLRASEFAKPDAAKVAGLDSPQLTASFSTAAPATQPSTTQPAFITLSLGHYDDIRKQNLYATITGSNAVAKVPASVLDRLKKTAWDLRDKKVLDIDPEAVTEIRLSVDRGTTTQPVKKETVLLRRPITTTQPAIQPSSTWLVKELTGTVAANDARVMELLSDLKPLRADKFLPSAPTTRPVAQYVLRLQTGGLRGMPVATDGLTLLDPGQNQPIIAQYNGLTFELSRTLLPKFEVNYVQDQQTPLPAVDTKQQ